MMQPSRVAILASGAMLAGAMALIAPAAWAGDAGTIDESHIVGRWQLLPERSDDGEKAVDFLMPGRGGEEDRPRRGPMGRPGGGMGRPGGMGDRGRMGGFPGPRGSGQRLSPEERAAARASIRFAVESPANLEVRSEEGALVLVYPDGRVRRLSADGRTHRLEGRTQKARWKDGRLVVETRVAKIKIKESFEPEAEPEVLRVDVVVEHPRYEGELKLARTYRRNAAAAPEGSDVGRSVAMPQDGVPRPLPPGGAPREVERE